jgi:aspartyl-tRNA synthetase
MNRFGSDRPDLRFGMELVDVTDIAKGTEFKVFQNALSEGGLVKAIRVPGGGDQPRSYTDQLASWVQQFGAGGLPVTKVEGGQFATGIAKFVQPVYDKLAERLQLQDGDLVAFGVSSSPAVVNRVLGELRVRLAHDLDMIEPNQWQWLWVVDFPLVEWDPEGGYWDSLHHPFTAPADEDLDKLESDPASVKSKAYDLVLNGSELGGGSVRIHRPDVQQRVFNLLGIDEEAAREKFGFLLDALKYGAPPHGGIAFGLDRLIMHLCGTSNIRDVIPFPKTQNGADLMTQAPAPVDEMQLQELQLRVQSARKHEVHAES